jgi:cytochrome c-type biogenesis protein
MSTVVLAADVTTTVTSGPFLVAALLSVAAGVVSFASPCVLPVVPGYLSYLLGLVGAETAPAGTGTGQAPTGGVPTGDPGNRGVAATPASTGTTTAAARGPRVRARLVGATALFVAGFTVVFALQAWAVLGLSHLLLANQDALLRVAGVVVLAMGLVMAGFVRPLQRERRFHIRPRGRVLGAPLLGGAFALGWTVCLGPTLVGVLALANATELGGASWRGLGLVLCYCLGLGVPFLLLALGFGWATRSAAVLRRHTRTIQLVGAAALVVLGLLMVTGLWGSFISWLQVRAAGFGTVL